MKSTTDNVAKGRYGPSVRGMLDRNVSEPTRTMELVSAAEWEARVALAACYRLVAEYGMTDMVYNHITARVPDEPHHFLINAYGLHYTEITASNLHKINHKGEIVLRASGTHLGVNHAGFVIHGAIHRGRPDVNCVIHTHTRAGTAVSSLKCGLLPLSLQGMKYARNIGYHDCEGIVVGGEEEERLVKNLGEPDAMILRNHGLLVVGRTIPSAFNALFRLERACQVQVMALSCNTKLIMPSTEVLEATFDKMRPRTDKPNRNGDLAWPALLRKLDRIDPSYKN